MNKLNPHKKAIQIVTSDNVNWKALVIKIAQDAPSVLCKAYNTIDTTDELHKTIREELKCNRKLSAIKMYRAETGVGLREAKEYIDKMVEGLGY